MHKFTLFNFIEIKIAFLTKKERTLRDIRERGKIWAIKLYRERYGSSLKDALDYVRSLDGEVNAESN